MNRWPLEYVNQEAQGPHRSPEEQWPTDIHMYLWFKQFYEVKYNIYWVHDRKVMLKFGCYKLFGSWGNVSNNLSYFHIFFIISSSKWVLPLIWANLKAFYLSIPFAKFGWKWLSVSERDGNVKSLRRQPTQTTDENWIGNQLECLSQVNLMYLVLRWLWDINVFFKNKYVSL